MVPWSGGWSLGCSSLVEQSYVLICSGGGSWIASVLGSGLILVFPYFFFDKFHLSSFSIKSSPFMNLLVWGDSTFVHSLVSFNPSDMEWFSVWNGFFSVGCDFFTRFLHMISSHDLYFDSSQWCLISNTFHFLKYKFWLKIKIKNIFYKPWCHLTIIKEDLFSMSKTTFSFTHILPPLYVPKCSIKILRKEVVIFTSHDMIFTLHLLY